MKDNSENISMIDSLIMDCQKCKKKFYEKEIDVSHDSPVYLFYDSTKKGRKESADKKGRHNLCKECHDTYERKLLRRIYKLVLKENLVLNNPDRRSLIKHIEKIKKFPIIKKIHCQKIAENVSGEFFNE